MLELHDPTSPSITSGIIEISLDLLQRGTTKIEKHIDADVQLNREHHDAEEKARAFYTYAKGWWLDFCGVRAGNADRLVKVFSTDEEGRRLPVSCFIERLRS